MPVTIVEQGLVETTVANTRAGTVKACRRSELSMALGGLVQKLNVKKGDKITANQVLVELRGMRIAKPRGASRGEFVGSYPSTKTSVYQ